MKQFLASLLLVICILPAFAQDPFFPDQTTQLFITTENELQNPPQMLDNTGFYTPVQPIQSTSSQGSYKNHSVILDYLLFAFSLTYQYRLPLSDLVDLSAGGGFGGGFLFMEGVFLTGEANLLIGGNKHYFEPGISAYTSRDWPLLIKAGYRFEAPGGFIFRAYTGLNVLKMDNTVMLPVLSFGYAF